MNHAKRPPDSGAGSVTRRDVLRAGLLAGPAALAAGSPASGVTSRPRNVILILMVGGPSQLDTFDPKPDAPAEIRGPFRAIPTAVPGVRLCEHLPGLARRLDRVALIRTLHHNAAPIHETGHQLLQTGRLFPHDVEYPHIGALVAARHGLGVAPPFAILPQPLGQAGIGIPQGQGPRSLGSVPGTDYLDADSDWFERITRRETDSPSVCASYGPSEFGLHCLLARRLVEHGCRLVTINMATTVFNAPSWDAHGAAPFASLDDYARTLLPAFDQGFCALIDDLDSRGLLDSTLVVAAGEFGRTPRLNANGGRDHWPGCFSAVLAGGGVCGGAVLGRSTPDASEPAERPVTLPELHATMLDRLGLDPRGVLPGADVTALRLAAAPPIGELLA